MPRVKIDYVVSFSSEDPEHPASNLLHREVSKKKWLCKKGESSCSVVLQLPRTVKITGVHIGAYHAALVEVLVGRSETSSEQFQVLVPSSVFISREDSRRDTPVVRVRSFGADALSAPARDQRWDRVRLVCSQPHNKHCQFGLSFVHVDEAEAAPGAWVPARLLALDTFSSDEDDFKPGELFAKHLQNTSRELQPNTSCDTGAQIRQATSQALKNIPEASTKLVKTPISKQPGGTRAPSPPAACERADRARDSLLYSRRDCEPQRAQADTAAKRETEARQNESNRKPKDDSKPKAEPKMTPKRNQSDSPPRPQKNNDKLTSEQNKEVRKRRRSTSQEQPDEQELPGPRGLAPHTLLEGAVLVLSGYQNPLRAELRALALALGARVQRDWGPGCTHLICAFPNTPKLREVRSCGRDVAVVRGDWLRELSRRRRVLPWRWYATEPRRRLQPRPQDLLDHDDPPPDTRQAQHHSDSDGDTDDEIEKVLRAQKTRRLAESRDVADTRGASPAPADAYDDVSTDEEGAGGGAGGGRAGRGGALPQQFGGLTFALDAAPRPRRLMQRYVRAYGGLVVEMSELRAGGAADYVVRGEGRAGGAGAGARGAREVPAAWLARCHAAGALLPHDH